MNTRIDEIRETINDRLTAEARDTFLAGQMTYAEAIEHTILVRQLELQNVRRELAATKRGAA